jgi:hypothetical protein
MTLKERLRQAQSRLSRPENWTPGTGDGVTTYCLGQSVDFEMAAVSAIYEAIPISRHRQGEMIVSWNAKATYPQVIGALERAIAAI